MGFLYCDARECHEALKFEMRLRRGDGMCYFWGVLVRILGN
jgi:hypothetical protein